MALEDEKTADTSPTASAPPGAQKQQMHRLPWKFRRTDLALILILGAVGVGISLMLALRLGGLNRSQENADRTTAEGTAAGETSGGNAAGAGGAVDENGSQVVITADGTEYGSWPLSQNVEIPVKSAGGTNDVVIRDGEVWMEKASCANQICVETGKISHPGQIIVCLPNRVVVEIQAGSAGKTDGAEAGSTGQGASSVPKEDADGEGSTSRGRNSGETAGGADLDDQAVDAVVR